MITPFVSLYTGGISDIDYYQPLFATLLCLAEYVYCTSLTYNNMIMAAGHIKQTQWISVTEAIINIVLSLILVKWIGIIGVALGTLIAFAFNTVANIVYRSTSNADWWICDFYDSAGGRQCGGIFGTGSSNDSASMVHIRRGET